MTTDIKTLISFVMLFVALTQCQFGVGTPLFMYPPTLNFLDSFFQGSLIVSNDGQNNMVFYSGTLAVQKIGDKVNSHFNTTIITTEFYLIKDLSWQFSTPKSAVVFDVSQGYCSNGSVPYNGSQLFCGSWQMIPDDGTTVVKWELRCTENFANETASLIFLYWMTDDIPVFMQMLVLSPSITGVFTLTFVDVTGQPPADSEFILPPYCTHQSKKSTHGVSQVLKRFLKAQTELIPIG